MAAASNAARVGPENWATRWSSTSRTSGGMRIPSPVIAASMLPSATSSRSSSRTKNGLPLVLSTSAAVSSAVRPTTSELARTRRPVASAFKPARWMTVVDDARCGPMSGSRTAAVIPACRTATRDARGMAVKFYRPDGTTTDIVAISLPAFFARTPEDLLAFNAARRPDPETGQPDLARVGAVSRRTPRGDGGRERGDHASHTRQLRHAGVPQSSCLRVRSARRHRQIRALPPRPGARRSEHHG